MLKGHRYETRLKLKKIAPINYTELVHRHTDYALYDANAESEQSISSDDDYDDDNVMYVSDSEISSKDSFDIKSPVDGKRSCLKKERFSSETSSLDGFIVHDSDDDDDEEVKFVTKISNMKSQFETNTITESNSEDGTNNDNRKPFIRETSSLHEIIVHDSDDNDNEVEVKFVKEHLNKRGTEGNISNMKTQFETNTIIEISDSENGTNNDNRKPFIQKSRSYSSELYKNSINNTKTRIHFCSQPCLELNPVKLKINVSMPN